MWMDRKVYESFLIDTEHTLTKLETLEREHASQQATMDWLMVRVTQLEKERAALLMVVTHGEVRIETPVISRDPVSPIPQNAPVDAMDLFTDMGDDKATQLGIGWNDDGTLKRL